MREEKYDISFLSEDRINNILESAKEKGDAKSLSIAAASIIAKVTRDRQLVEEGKKYPEYHFEKHKGYGTKAHREALLQYGVTPIHRKTFLTKILGENEK